MQTIVESAGALKRIGKKASQAACRLAETLQACNTKPAFAQTDDPFYDLGEAFRGWSDEDATRVIESLETAISSGSDIEGAQLVQWIRAHSVDSDTGEPAEDRAEAVIDCIETKPPEHVSIIRRLSTAGSQKLVFLAKWQTTQSEIVLKRFRNKELAHKVIDRELMAHALSLKHPNIIETHLQQNIDNEPFLLERRLPEVFSDDRVPHSVVEAANLLHDMANALEFLEGEQLVHGDLKPDNIGREHGRSILLDFGICRSAKDFQASDATGSLRTRAPELLVGGDEHHSYASDVWALGATVYRGFMGRFPLIREGDVVPRIWENPQRTDFEKLLAKRAEEEFDQIVTFENVPDQIRPLLERMLTKDPTLRITSKQVIEYCHKHLAAVLREHDGRSRLAPTDEIAKLVKFLPDASVLRLMPHFEYGELKKRLGDLENKKGLTQDQVRQIAELKRSRFPPQ